MEAWAHQQNIEHFERDLLSETNPDRRRLLQSLIQQEHERLEEILTQRGKPKGD